MNSVIIMLKSLRIFFLFLAVAPTLALADNSNDRWTPQVLTPVIKNWAGSDSAISNCGINSVNKTIECSDTFEASVFVMRLYASMGPIYRDLRYLSELRQIASFTPNNAASAWRQLTFYQDQTRNRLMEELDFVTMLAENAIKLEKELAMANRIKLYLELFQETRIALKMMPGF